MRQLKEEEIRLPDQIPQLRYTYPFSCFSSIDPTRFERPSPIVNFPRPEGPLEKKVSGEIFSYDFLKKEFEEELHTYYFGARFYDPEIGVWLTPDPAREFINPYSYVGGDPINYVDPLGLNRMESNEKNWKWWQRAWAKIQDRGGYAVGDKQTDAQAAEAKQPESQQQESQQQEVARSEAPTREQTGGEDRPQERERERFRPERTNEFIRMPMELRTARSDITSPTQQNEPSFSILRTGEPGKGIKKTVTAYVNARIKYGRYNTPYLEGTFTYGDLSYKMRSGLKQSEQYISKAPIPEGKYEALKMRSPTKKNIEKMTDLAGNPWFIPISSPESDVAGWEALGVHPIKRFSAGCIGIIGADQQLYNLLTSSPLQYVVVKY